MDTLELIGRRAVIAALSALSITGAPAPLRRWPQQIKAYCEQEPSSAP